ncbi:hypothetical protein TREMEDRAFT_31674 [Tremella mesenterica DSM 1558]|uniref:uncharacterized protein n=1 Tax=Tremella mesenterica (strain ATCC 24925 / CBS 8224 / DSM 1558 / NBRC 9311 / NRRL Y-6157 / RJB 2259-6 / UBC 559-6) TaxID=578456 RepID=UPI0003F49A24|nr:uncharacterized protein TREMEDRAFT_31674 [Tremella mesenterica DSM 1558]EIW68601.1 hypothetical protein TREMEDRAFT_31674 [Tremella mesenterica DSM 1558]
MSSADSSSRNKKDHSRKRAVDDDEVDPTQLEVPKNKRHRKEKPWDTDDIDHWKIDPFPPPPVTSHTPFAEESSFSLLFPKYREPKLRTWWGEITSKLKTVELDCELDLVQGKMTVKTTRKTWDPYVVLKGRDMLKLLARGVDPPQVYKILQDDIACDVIPIGGLVRNKERFVKRRARILGPNGSTLKAIELLTECYVLVQGNTVSAMGSYKGLKEVRRIIVDCMNNIHPIYRIKELMIRRELAKDPKLVNENWDRFLPKFQKRHLKTSEKTARKNAKLSHPQLNNTNPNAIVIQNDESSQSSQLKTTEKPKKKIYTPFPPPQQPSKLDLQMASGEYFLKPKEREALEKKRRLEKQAEKAEKKKSEREEAFIAPPEKMGEKVKERKKKRPVAEDLM